MKRTQLFLLVLICSLLIQPTTKATVTDLPTLADEISGAEIGEGTRNLVLCIHGWNNPKKDNRYSETDEWSFLVSKIRPVMKANTSDPWALVLYDWSEDAATGFIDFFGDENSGIALSRATQASVNAREHGTILATRLPHSLRRVHIISHSAGTWCAREVAAGLLANNPYVVIQITFLDPFIPDAVRRHDDFSKSRIEEIAILQGADRIWLLENYYAHDFPAGIVAPWTLGTQERFSWRPFDMNLQVEWDPDPLHPPFIYAYYDYHSGPTVFYGDTIAAAASGDVSPRLPPDGDPYLYQGYGWYNALFHRTDSRWASLPRITTQPQSKTVVSGTSVTLNVTGRSILPLKYQWFKNGQQNGIASATSSSYTFAASDQSEGKYLVRVSDSTGMIYSDVATVTVTDAPQPPSLPAIARVSPSTLVGLPLPQTQLIRVIGSGFTSGSTLLFNGTISADPARLQFISPNELNYYIRTDTTPSQWTVKVINAGQHSNLAYFNVVPPVPNTGAISVSLSPGGAVVSGAQWQVDGGIFRNSGDTVYGLAPGTHTVAFKSVVGYDRPVAKFVAVTSGTTTAAVGTYTIDEPETYSLNVSANHGRVIVSPELNDYPYGTEVRLIANPNDGYLFDHWSGSASGTERIAYVRMTRDRNVTANFALDTSVGHIRVTISPLNAVAEGAQWKYRNYTAWQNSGLVLDYIETGTGSVIFKDIPGWITPSPISATILGGQTTNINAAYREILGAVQVTLYPEQAVAAGARWRISGGAWLESGAVLQDVAPGSQSIEFLAGSNWTPPPAQSVFVERGVTASPTGVFVPPPGVPAIAAISPKTGTISGGTIVTVEGANFQPGAAVAFGGIYSTEVNVISSTRLTAVTPTRASYGSVDVYVSVGTHLATQTNGFSYLNPVGSNIELVGQFGGNVEAVAVSGDLVCYGEGSGIVIADISNPAAPIVRGRMGLPAVVKDLAFVSNIVYVADNTAGLYAIDVSAPASPAIRGFYDTPGTASGIAVDENIAYVADGSDGGLQLLDVSNLSAIVRLGFLDTPARAARISVGKIGSAKYAFLSEAGSLDSCVRVIEVTDPRTPVERTTVSATSTAGMTDVKIVGTTLFVSDWQAGIKIFDASSPANLTQIGLRRNVGGGAFVDVIDGRLYTCSSTLRVSDPSILPTPPVLGLLDVGSFCYDMIVTNGTAFVAMGKEGLKLVNVTNPSALSFRSILQTVGAVQDVCVQSSVAFVGNDSGLYSLDISNPARPSKLGALSITQGLTDLAVSNGKAIMVRYGESNVRIASVTNPSLLSLLGTYTNAEAWNVALWGSTPILAAATRDAAHQPKLDILDLAIPSSPQASASFVLDSSNGYAAAVAVAGNWVFLGRPNVAVDVVSLSNPVSPQKVGSLQTGSFMRDIAASPDGNYIYIGDTTLGVIVVDVRIKTAPAISHIIDPPQSPGTGVETLHVSGQRLFVVEAGFLFVYDLTTASSPQLLAYYDLPSTGYGISVVGDLILVAGYNSGLHILRLLDIEKPTISILQPTSNALWHTNATPITLQGVSSDIHGTARVIWENSRGGSGEASGTDAWTAAGIALQPGENIISVTAYDREGNSATDIISVIHTAPLMTQAINFSPLPDRTFADPPFLLSATASSGLPLIYTVLTGPAVLSNNLVTLTGAGTVTIRAIQPGNSSYDVAVPVERTFSVLKAPQSIEVELLPEYSLNESFTLTGNASSGLPITFSIASGPATITSNIVTFSGLGVVTIRAEQPGNNNFNTAPPLQCSVDVVKVPQSISFRQLSLQIAGDEPFLLSAIASSGLPVSFSVLSGPAIVSGNFLTLTGSGFVVLRASQSGDGIYAAAPNVDQILSVIPGNGLFSECRWLPTGTIAFRYFGEMNTPYVVYGSTNLSNWVPVGTNITSSQGYFDFVDLTATNHNQRFYRVVP